MAHRPRRGKGFEKVIDVLRWAGANSLFQAQSAGTAALVFITDGATETLMRIRGEILCWQDAAVAPPRSVEVGIGCLVVQAGTGTTVIQAPLTDPDAPWLMYERFTIGYEEPVTDVIDIPGITSIRKVIDSKAMRILRPGREVQLVMEQATLGAATSVNLSFGHRVLLGSH